MRPAVSQTFSLSATVLKPYYAIAKALLIGILFILRQLLC